MCIRSLFESFWAVCSVPSPSKGHAALPLGTGATTGDALRRRQPVAAAALAPSGLLLRQGGGRGEGQAGGAQEVEVRRQGRGTYFWLSWL